MVCLRSERHQVSVFFIRTIGKWQKFTVHILQEHDHLIISNENEIVTLVPGEVKECGVAPNQLKNSITIGMK